MRRKVILLFLVVLMLVGCGRLNGTRTAPTPSGTASSAPSPTATTLPEPSPMAVLLRKLCEEYDPAQGAMETKRRCEELLAAWVTSGEDETAARSAISELLRGEEIDPKILGDRLEALSTMAVRLCSGDAGLVRESVLPTADSAERLFEALFAELSGSGVS